MRILWTTETCVMSEMRTNEEQQDGDSTGGRGEEKKKSGGVKLKVEFKKEKGDKWEEGRESRKNRFIMEQI